MSTSSRRLRYLAQDRPRVALILSVLSVEVVGASGALFTSQGLATWYETLRRPALAPPNWIFGPVWTVLFALIGIAVWLVWRQADTAEKAVKRAMAIFSVHFCFNIGWSAAFFGMQNIGLGLVVILLLLGFIGATIWAFARIDRRAAWLLVPYLLWVAFATYLNYRFWTLN